MTKNNDAPKAVDAQYTTEPFLSPVHDLGIPVLGRVANNRVFFLPPPYPGFGRPRVRGRKIKLNDARTLPAIDAKDEWEIEGGSRIEVSRWDDIRMRKWPGQRLALYRVIEYKADGKPRYKRPLWLIFVPTSLEIELPTPRQAQAIYDERFSAGLLSSLGWSKPEPKTRGKSPGRAEGMTVEARKQFNAYRKTA